VPIDDTVAGDTATQTRRRIHRAISAAQEFGRALRQAPGEDRFNVEGSAGETAIATL
jgi:hypothetical protein